MAPLLKDDPSVQDRLTRQINEAFSRGQAALADGDRKQATRWLGRAHRLAPADGTIALVLASAAIGDDNAAAAAGFQEVLGRVDVRDAWLGLATARFLLGEITAARQALSELLARYALRSDANALAERIARETCSGWCGLTGQGVLFARPIGAGPVSVAMDGKPVVSAGGDDGEHVRLPGSWPRSRVITAMAADGGHLIGSPISLRAIGRVEGQVETWEGGPRGWAWCPGDPEADPGLVLVAGGRRTQIAMGELVAGVAGLPPLARPRAFALELPTGEGPMRVRGRDGRNLAGGSGRAGAAAVSSCSGSTRAPVGAARRRTSDVVSGSSDPRLKAEDDGLGAGHDGTAAGQDGIAAEGHVGRRVILITHDDGGGVEQRIQAAVAAHTGHGRQTIVLRPTKPADGPAGLIVETSGLPTKRLELPRQRAALLRLLREAAPADVELHHFLNHDPLVFDIIRALGVPYDVHTHDYAWFCPRIALVGRGGRYCGEPAAATCETCVAQAGSYLHEPISVPALLARSAAVLRDARRVIAPSDDTAARMARHFPGVAPIVIPHEDDAAIAEPPPIPQIEGSVRICVAGAIGLHKGYDVLLACARDAKKRRLELEFVVAGTTTDDERLMRTGRVFVTGPYRPEEAVALIRAQDAAWRYSRRSGRKPGASGCPSCGAPACGSLPSIWGRQPSGSAAPAAASCCRPGCRRVRSTKRY